MAIMADCLGKLEMMLTEDGANGIEVAVHRNNQELNKPMQGSDEE